MDEVFLMPCALIEVLVVEMLRCFRMLAMIRDRGLGRHHHAIEVRNVLVCTHTQGVATVAPRQTPTSPPAPGITKPGHRALRPVGSLGCCDL